MDVVAFTDLKIKQLCYYLKAFWRTELPHNELELFFWDTLEEWAQVEYSADQPYSQRERVFWHLLHQLHFWPEEKLRFDLFLREELNNCVTFLDGQGMCPFDCVGIRP